MPLIKGGEPIDDPWVPLAQTDEIPPGGALLVSLEQWRARREALLARGGRLGIRLASDQPPAEIAGDLRHFQLVALDFPSFGDGRPYSSARLLREQLGFEGELRAVGDVGLDQLHFMHRSGFDAFEIESETALEDWRTAESEMRVWYQPTADGRVTAAQLRKS